MNVKRARAYNSNQLPPHPYLLKLGFTGSLWSEILVHVHLTTKWCDVSECPTWFTMGWECLSPTSRVQLLYTGEACSCPCGRVHGGLGQGSSCSCGGKNPYSPNHKANFCSARLLFIIQPLKDQRIRKCILSHTLKSHDRMACHSLKEALQKRSWITC